VKSIGDYAHTAADYLQFYFKLPIQISAADIAVEYNERLWPRILSWFRREDVPQSGFIRAALWDALDMAIALKQIFLLKCGRNKTL